MTIHISYLVLAATWLKTTDNTFLRQDELLFAHMFCSLSGSCLAFHTYLLHMQ